MSASGKEPTADAPQARDQGAVQNIAEAMADPFRIRLLTAVAERRGITIRQIAARLAETDRKVRYHVEALVEDGLIEVHDEVRRRGTMERHYRVATPIIIRDTDEQWVSEANRRRISLEVLKIVMADATSSVSSGRFGTRDGHCEVRLRGEVDAQGWDELATVFQNAMDDSQEVIRRSTERREQTGEPGVEVTAALFLFEALLWNAD